MIFMLLIGSALAFTALNIFAKKIGQTILSFCFAGVFLTCIGFTIASDRYYFGIKK